jgi:lysophospholipase L1-like esterase
VWAAKPNRWSRHNELELASSKHWTKHNAYRLEGDDDPGYLGAMGQAMSATSKRAWSELRPGRRSESAQRIASYELHHLVQAGGGHYVVKIDGERVAELDTGLPRGESTPRLGRHRLDVERGAHTLRIELQGDGEVRMLGVVAETGEPGIVLDTLGVNGAKSANQLRWNEALWAEQLKLRDPVLYVLAFGNNESVDEDDPIAQYEADYRAVLERFRRTLPEAGCLILGPGDFPKFEEGELLPRPRLMEIRAVQQRLAPEYRCAFYDALSFAGGEGAKRAWVDAGLARDDYLHLTRAGYVRFGLGFADSLMQHYDLGRAK